MSIMNTQILPTVQGFRLATWEYARTNYALAWNRASNCINDHKQTSTLKMPCKILLWLSTSSSFCSKNCSAIYMCPQKQSWIYNLTQQTLLRLKSNEVHYFITCMFVKQRPGQGMCTCKNKNCEPY